MKLYTKYKIRIVYKSGYQHDFWVWKFSINYERGLEMKWNFCDDGNKPIDIACKLEDIEAVWQIGYKKVFRFTDPLKEVK